MKKLLRNKYVIITLIVLVLIGIGKIWWNLTENSRARKYGGTINIELKENEKFMNVTFKEEDIWYLVEDTVKNQYIFKEYSKYGMMNGKVVFKKSVKK